jgi:phage shock protein A
MEHPFTLRAGPLVAWLLAAILGLLTYMAGHAVQKMQELDARIDKNESSISALYMYREDTRERLNRIETKIDQLRGVPAETRNRRK